MNAEGTFQRGGDIINITLNKSQSGGIALEFCFQSSKLAKISSA